MTKQMSVDQVDMVYVWQEAVVDVIESGLQDADVELTAEDRNEVAKVIFHHLRNDEMLALPDDPDDLKPISELRLGQ